MKFWVLFHIYPINEDRDRWTYIGVFSTEERACAAMALLKDEGAFAEHPDGFSIADAEVDRVWWSEGFFTWTPGSDPG